MNFWYGRLREDTEIILSGIENHIPCTYGSLHAYSIFQSGRLSAKLYWASPRLCSVLGPDLYANLWYMCHIYHMYTHNAQAKVKILLLTYFKYHDLHASPLNHLQIVYADWSSEYHLLLFQVHRLSNCSYTMLKGTHVNANYRNLCSKLSGIKLLALKEVCFSWYTLPYILCELT